MLRVTLYINHRFIGHIGAVNTDERRHRQTENGEIIQIKYDLYDLRGWRGDVEEPDEFPKIEEVWHDQDDDAASLTSAVMEAVNSEEALINEQR